MGHVDLLPSYVMSSCGSAGISVKLKGPKNLDKVEERAVEEQLNNVDKEDKESFKGLEIIRTPRTTVFICPKNSNYSSDHNFSRFKTRYG